MMGERERERRRGRERHSDRERVRDREGVRGTKKEEMGREWGQERGEVG